MNKEGVSEFPKFVKGVKSPTLNTIGLMYILYNPLKLFQPNLVKINPSGTSSVSVKMGEIGR